MDTDAAQKSSWLEKGAPALTGIAALIAALLYFVGWQYKQSLALTFGFAGYPGDLSFQGTVATGVAVFDSKILPFVVGAIWLIYGALLAIGWIPQLLRYLLNKVRSKKITTVKLLRKVRKDLDKEAVEEAELVHLEKEMYRLGWQMRGLLGLTKSFKYTPAFGVLLISCVSIGILIVLIYAGHLVARMDAKAIRSQALGKCEGCFIYDMKLEKVVGVPLFQSAETIYIQHRGGLVRVSVENLKTIRPYGKSKEGLLRLPRR